MFRKLFLLISLIFVLGAVLTSVASAADPNLIGWLKFDEGSGTTCADSSGNSNDGSFGVDKYGNPEPNNAPQWVDGRIGERCLKFFPPYGLDFVDCGNSSIFDVNGPMTVTCWIKGSWNYAYGSVIAKGGNSWMIYFSLYYRDMFQYSTTTDPGFNATANIGTGTYADGRWHLTAGVYTGSQVELYFDGILVAVEVGSGNQKADPNNLYIGAMSGNTSPQGWYGHIDDVRLYNRALTADEILAMYNQPIDVAYNLNPADAAVIPGNVDSSVTLRWSQSPNAVSTKVYFGTSNPPPLVASQAADNNTYTPPAAGISSGVIYYWKIGEVNNNNDPNVYETTVRSFSVTDYIMLDSFEFYYTNEQIAAVWVPSYAATVQINSAQKYAGGKSMRLNYYNNGGYGSYSEANQTFASVKDWTKGNLKVLTLYFMGTSSSNNPDNLYAILRDSLGHNKTIEHPNNPDAIMVTDSWQEWTIPLSDFNDGGVDLTKIKNIVFGIGDRDVSGSFASGEVSFDNITLYPPRCIFAEGPVGDMAGNTGDCKVDNNDLRVMSDDWLSEHPGLVLWYKFEETEGNDVHDSSGHGYTGTISYDNGNTDEIRWNPHGKVGRCVYFSKNNYVDIPTEVLSTVRDEITIAFWAYGDPNETWAPNNKTGQDRVFHAKYGYDEKCRVFDVRLPEPNNGNPSGITDSAYFGTSNSSSFGGYNSVTAGSITNAQYRTSWNHYAFTKDADSGLMTIYFNGVPVSVGFGKYLKMYGADRFYDGRYNYTVTGVRIGHSLWEYGMGYWYMFGRLDEFRIYDYVLSDSNINRLANLQEPLQQRGDFDQSGRINFNDFAEFGNSWLEEKLWP